LLSSCEADLAHAIRRAGVDCKYLISRAAPNGSGASIRRNPARGCRSPGEDENAPDNPSIAIGIAVLLMVVAAARRRAQQSGMSFFVTSAGPGKGADLGGLVGADRQCQQLAQAAGAGGHTWRAYLSAQAPRASRRSTPATVSAAGPGRTPRASLSPRMSTNCTAPTTSPSRPRLTEQGDIVNGRGDTPNKHDALTGTTPDGKTFPPGDDKTCGNWTSSAQGTAIVGHIDRQGPARRRRARSWNSSHPSRGPDGGCQPVTAFSAGGDGLFYCFAVN